MDGRKVAVGDVVEEAATGKRWAVIRVQVSDPDDGAGRATLRRLAEGGELESVYTGVRLAMLREPAWRKVA